MFEKLNTKYGRQIIYLSIITVNVIGLNSQLKDNRLNYKTKPNYMFYIRDISKPNKHRTLGNQTSTENDGKKYQANTNKRKTVVFTLIADKIEFKA